MNDSSITRRRFCQSAAAVWAAASARPASLAAETGGFRLNYILGSPMYGTAPLAEVLPEVHKIGARQIDVWPRPHADHREQIEAMGLDRFRELLDQHHVELGAITRYDLGPRRIDREMPTLQQLGGRLIVSGAGRGEPTKAGVQKFVAQLRPQIELAEELGLTIGIENHAHSLIHSLDSIRWFAELAESSPLGLALAPYHLPQEPETIAKLIVDLGPKVVFFQAWQYGMGCMKKLPKEQEMLQLPGRGPLDFRPILAALAKIHYQGWTEIFMHPTPRGIPIRETTADVTAEINRSRAYLEQCLQEMEL